MVRQQDRGYVPLTLARSADWIVAGEDLWAGVREFLDDFYAAPGWEREALIDERPALTGDRRMDAYLGALAEHLVVHYRVVAPDWVHGPERFLDRFWFPTSIKALHATALVESPASFRRRGIFVDETELKRY